MTTKINKTQLLFIKNQNIIYIYIYSNSFKYK